MNKSAPKVLKFPSLKAFRSWLVKNHQAQTEVWVQFRKKGYEDGGLRYPEALDETLCFGWAPALVKSLDLASYKVRFYRRHKKSRWSQKVMARYKVLQKEGRMSKAGEAAFRMRDKERSGLDAQKFPKPMLQKFQSHPEAWAFFQSCNPSYRKSARSWILEARRSETRDKRLQELIKDSASGTKLQRFLKAIEKYKPRYEPGRTPIEAARNIGPVTGGELRSIGVATVEALRAKGWEETFQELCEVHWHRMNLIMLKALIGAVEGIPLRQLDQEQNRRARRFLQELRSGWAALL